MIQTQLVTIDGILLANEYVRVVHGGRGPYIELTYDQIVSKLCYKFGSEFKIDEVDMDVDFYYYWLHPENSECKVYYQLKTVKYADYKVGMFYISPSLIKNFQDPEELCFS